MPSDYAVVEQILDLYKEDPRRWIQERSATDANGRAVGPSDPDAACFCLSGGIDRYSDTEVQRNRLNKLLIRFAPNSYGSVPAFNDSKKTNVEHVKHVLQSVLLDLSHRE